MYKRLNEFHSFFFINPYINPCIIHEVQSCIICMQTNFKVNRNYITEVIKAHPPPLPPPPPSIYLFTIITTFSFLYH